VTVNQEPLTGEEIDRLFKVVADPPANTFELALVLGGTVSAGAYTAGAVDFLIEALDCWTRLREPPNPDTAAPKHKVVLKFITGTSGGGVNAAIAARALAYDFPHVVRSTPNPEGGTGNPFYDVWVNRLTLNGFLGTSDIDQGKVVSLLDGKPIDDGAAFIANFKSGDPIERTYIGDPLRVILTLTNLCGVPYKTPFGGTLTEIFVDHADYIRTAIVYPGRSLANPRPDELAVGFDNARLPQAIDWMTFSQFGRATAAFPLGFPPRPLVRPMEHYRYRVAVLPGDGEQPIRVIGRQPDWAEFIPAGSTEVPSDYHFLAVDGGATDNEPIELARTALAGILGRNPRDPKKANRGVMLIDPFAGKTGLGPTGPSPLITIVGAIGSTFTEQTRYDSQDLLLASDPDVFSRYMITPQQDGKVGGDAIAAAGLGAFIGFACPAFMRHDYLLGRANCQAYLRTEFALHEDNPVFQGGVWTATQKRQFGMVVDGQRYLPLIPLMGDAAVPETLGPWPRHQLDPGIYEEAIESRFKAIVEFEGSSGILSSAAAWFLAHFGESKVADFVINQMKKALSEAGLD
jgi:hypothetical protein